MAFSQNGIFFPATPDALSPLLETVRVTEPPKPKERTATFGSMNGMAVTAAPVAGWYAFGQDKLNVRNMAGEFVLLEDLDATA